MLIKNKSLRVVIIILAMLIAGILINTFVINDPNSIIPNRQLERVIREQIGKSSGELTPKDCLGITELNLSASDFNSNLEGLQYFVDLEKLDCSAGRIHNISAISGLTKLEELKLYKNQVRDLTPLSGLVNLERLDLYDNNVHDLTPLATLTNLKLLVIGKNPVTNKEDFYAPLSHLYGLRIVSPADWGITIEEPPYED